MWKYLANVSKLQCSLCCLFACSIPLSFPMLRLRVTVRVWSKCSSAGLEGVRSTVTDIRVPARAALKQVKCVNVQYLAVILCSDKQETTI